MVQNLNTKIAFILALLILSVYLLVTKEVTLGLDLSGGSSLRYRLPIEAEGGVDPQEILEETVRVFRDRIDNIGLKEIPIRIQGEDEIIIELPGMPKSEVDNIIETIQTQGNMEWFIVAETEHDATAPDEVFLDLEKQRARLVEFLKAREAEQGGWDLSVDLTPLDVSMTINGKDALYRWMPVDPRTLEEEMKVAVPQKDSTLDALRRAPQEPDDAVAERYFTLIKIFKQPSWRFAGMDLSNVRAARDSTGLPAVGFEFRAGRAHDFAEFTRAHIKKQLAIVLDGKIMTDPVIRNELPGGGQIEGPKPTGFTQQEQQRLLTVLRSGSLTVKPVLLSRQDIGPTLGENSIRRGKLAAVIGLSAVFVFTVAYYFVAGLVASISLAFNLMLLMALLVFLEAVLTLPGIAGIVLTVGMAVDANILIFERIREEKEKGKTLVQAVKNGFERAFLTIVDSNATTFITAFILFQLGTGPIKGFAVTLMIGICTSVFAALVLSKVIFAVMLQKGLKSLNMLRILRNTNVDFLAARWVATGASLTAIVAGVALFISEDESKFGLDFTGGYNIHLVCTGDTTQADVQTTLGAYFPNLQVVSVKGNDEAPETADAKIYNVKIQGIALEEAVSRPGPAAEGPAAANEGAAAEGAAEAADSVDIYEDKIHEILGDRLLPEPITDVKLTPKPETESTAINATLNFFRPPATAEQLAEAQNPDDVYQANIKQALGGFVDVQQWEFSNGGRRLDIVAEYKVSSTITRERITAGVVRRLEDAKEEGLPIYLSDPFPMTDYIGPTVGSELRDKAVKAILGALIVIVIYIRFRFKEYKYGFAASIALIHDVLITLGAIAVVRLTGIVQIEIDLPIIAAFLTIIGYSLNDTIVIFDRIRENLPRVNRPFTEVINMSINQTLSRTILTSGTTLLVLIVLFAVNYGQRNVLEGFSFAMIVGVVTGTYSTIYIASPILVWIEGRKAKAG